MIKRFRPYAVVFIAGCAIGAVSGLALAAKLSATQVKTEVKR